MMVVQNYTFVPSLTMKEEKFQTLDTILSLLTSPKQNITIHKSLITKTLEFRTERNKLAIIQSFHLQSGKMHYWSSPTKPFKHAEQFQSILKSHKTCFQTFKTYLQTLTKSQQSKHEFQNLYFGGDVETTYLEQT